MTPITYPTPTFTEQEASKIARQLYDLDVLAKILPGEYDQNFYLKSTEGREFVLKISHAMEQYNNLDLQNQILQHLEHHAPSLALSRLCTTTTGESIATVTSTRESKHFVRLLTYVPGRLFAQTRPHTSTLLHSLGTMLGTLDRALLDFTHPAAQRTLKWDLQQIDWLHEYTKYIPDPERRLMVEQMVVKYRAQIDPVLPTLRTSVIHNDANDYNLLVNEEKSQEQCVISVLDFGDTIHTITIGELAIAVTYAMFDKPDPLAAASHVIAGYHSILPLTEAELEILYPLICLRLCSSVVNSAYRQRIEPNNAYLTISERPAWALLEHLSQVPSQLAHYTFRHACGLSPCPTTPSIIDWLKHNTDKIGRVIEPELTAATSLIFDLSIGSLELGNVSDYSDTLAFTQKFFGQIQSSGASVGIGKYNEARPIYSADMFKFQGNNGPEWRSVHVGLDLFLEPGAPVFAPLDGVVHSFANNSGRLDYGPTIILQHTVDNGRLTFYTLYGHLSSDSLIDLYEGKVVTQGMVIARIGNHLENGGWPPHLHFQLICDLLDRKGEFPGVVLPGQRDLWLSLCPDPNLIIGLPTELLASDALSIERNLEMRGRYLGRNLSIAYNNPLKIVRGYRQLLYDEDGRRYLDAVNNVPHVGHNHPHVVQAGQKQMAVLNTNTRYLYDSLVRYAERLCATLPEPLSVCYFVCSGSEANELALRLARAYTRQKDLLVIDVGYHGNTTTLIDISSYKFDGPGGEGAAAYVHKLPMPDTYRGPYKRDDPRAGEKYAHAAAEALEQIQQNGNGRATFIGESILSCGGQIVLPQNYLKEVYQHVHHFDGVCIADEVQTGFGRVGSHFWAFETQGVVPDIVTLGKPIGNGYPLGAVVTTPEIAAAFNTGMEYFNTFGGNAVACAIGMAVLDVITDEHLQANALSTGNHLLEHFRRLAGKYQLIGDVRGLGLFLGIELVRDRETLEPAQAQASYIANRMREHGILISTDGPLHNVLKIKPPLVFNKADADFLAATLDTILAEDRAQV